MIALPSRSDPTHTEACADHRATIGMIMLAIVIFFSSGVSAFLQGDRDFIQGQRTLAGEAGHVKASFREALLYSKRMASQPSGAGAVGDVVDDLLRLYTAWPLYAGDMLRLQRFTTGSDLPRRPTATRPGNPQAPPR
ncbi:hypothetical protein [Allohahella sp. A8]|uniref:hypothetical protein n=1 Tax=Allohahella sp. A8 TaxID=3141461 RepID=UPI003A7FEFB6